MFLLKPKRSPNYQIIYYRNGKRTSKSTGKTKKSDALRFLSEFYESINIKPEKPKLKISDYAKQYIEYMSIAHSPRYIQSISLSFKMLEKHIGDILLENIDVLMIEGFISNTYRRSKHAAKMYHKTLKAAFNRAINIWGYIEINPFNKVRAPKIPQSLPVFISGEEFKALLDITNEKLFKDIFTVAFFTGLRLGELTNLTWESISLQNKKIILRNTESFTTKSKRERMIPMTKQVQDIFSRKCGKVENENNYVFTRILNIRLNEDYVSKKFKRVVKIGGLNTKIHFHTLRHSFASNLVRKGVPLIFVKELMGHQDISTTQIYSHVRREDLTMSIKVLDNICI